MIECEHIGSPRAILKVLARHNSCELKRRKLLCKCTPRFRAEAPGVANMLEQCILVDGNEVLTLN